MATKTDLTPAEEFLIDRIREWPTLYANGDAVISNHIIGRGEYVWTPEGLIEDRGQTYDPETKSMVPYKKQVPYEFASSRLISKVHQISVPICLNGIINDIPLNAHPSWLHEFDMFLFSYRNFGEKECQLIADYRCLVNYNVWHNPHAGEPQRTKTNLMDFIKKIPSWEARIQEIRYFQLHGEIDPETFMGEGI